MHLNWKEIFLHIFFSLWFFYNNNRLSSFSFCIYFLFVFFFVFLIWICFMDAIVILLFFFIWWLCYLRFKQFVSRCVCVCVRMSVTSSYFLYIYSFCYLDDHHLFLSLLLILCAFIKYIFVLKCIEQ